MENKKIDFSKIIKNMKIRHEEYLAKNPDFFQKLKEQKQEKEASQFSFEEILKKINEAKEAK